MPIPKPGTAEYERMVEFMRADLLGGSEYTKQVNTLVEMTRKQMDAQGKDFDKEFAKWQAEKHECTYIDKDDTYLETDMYVCNNCGSSGESIEAIHHHGTCKNGEAKKWEEFYSENNEEEVM